MINYLWPGDKSHSKDRAERCCACDRPTGRAGILDDSLYTEDGEGPYCEDCWKEVNDNETD